VGGALPCPVPSASRGEPRAGAVRERLRDLGLGVLAAGALPHVAATSISDPYHAPEATTEEQATLVLLWQATEAMFDAFFVAGLLILPVGVIALGVALQQAPAFGAGVGRAGVALGMAGLVAGGVLLVDAGSAMAFVGVLALIVFHATVGWKMHRLSMNL
jgi:hypothetical protein